jgi:sporulation protein YlmC with PRC-barrel domain
MRTVSIADLVGSRVVLADGTRLGPVVDLEVTRGPEFRVTNLLIGTSAWLYRLDIHRLRIPLLGPRRKPLKVPWSAVAQCDAFTVTLKPGCDPRKTA